MRHNIRKEILKLIFNIQVSIFLVLLYCTSALKGQDSERPNVVLVLADQRRAEATGKGWNVRTIINTCMGSPTFSP